MLTVNVHCALCVERRGHPNTNKWLPPSPAGMPGLKQLQAASSESSTKVGPKKKRMSREHHVWVRRVRAAWSMEDGGFVPVLRALVLRVR